MLLCSGHPNCARGQVLCGCTKEAWSKMLNSPCKHQYMNTQIIYAVSSSVQILRLGAGISVAASCSTGIRAGKEKHHVGIEGTIHLRQDME